MIKVEFEVDKSVPTDKELLLFDRNAFQCMPQDVFHQINKKYNILCPIHFVIECISPNNSDNKDLVLFEKEKKALRDRLRSIENPIVFTGKTFVTHRIQIPSYIKDNEFIDLLTSWQIARNIIIDSPIKMQRMSPKVLISKCKVKIEDYKSERQVSTNTINNHKGSMSPKRYRSQIQKKYEELHNKSYTDIEIKRILRSNPDTHITQELDNVCRHVLKDIADEPKEEVVENMPPLFALRDNDLKYLRKKIRNNKKLTIENYPRLSYPIYIYFLIRYMLAGIQHNADHLDNSFFFDFQYLHYLNFCDKFIADETSTPYIIKVIPYREISNTPIRTSKQLAKELV